MVSSVVIYLWLYRWLFAWFYAACMDHCEECDSSDICDQCEEGWFFEPLDKKCKGRHTCCTHLHFCFLLPNSKPGSAFPKNFSSPFGRKETDLSQNAKVMIKPIHVKVIFARLT